ncbi:sphingomyelin phosphodiesterase [Nocardioides luteus]|uniref:Sphingomyelin phosphodiesterase n=1 Tax=Nocardioides luteus TaxID=1844 RepID=A0ABQ5SZM8_9ACTN|nr:sphingomyelin phosphodiesterase [Nocardioides luteus]MDR7312771.1 sphingomyelin phosphodiesterase [Nocardioides luteus]GGR47429.1 sphingomyelin phosphodiesterase [Nocardioides luteus]GLJ69023.1 sphingomyelin phosphodiesterase [Nocardioides luteus]
MRRLAAGLAVAAIGLTGLVGLGAPGPAAAAPSSSRPAPALDILTHNIAMLPGILGGKANATRADLFAEADHVRGHDIVVLQEAFANGPSETIKSRLSAQYPHQTPVLGRSRSGWDETLGSYSALTPEDGGVTILSRWPITHRTQYVYADGCDADWFSNKGFVYARLEVEGRPVHVVGTHVQAEAALCADASATRAKQFAELDGFLDGLAIPADEPIVIAGDLNVVRESPEYAAMLSALDVTAPTFAGHPYSWDPETNPLASSGGREQLDYVLFRRGHAQPRGWTNTTLTPASPPWSYLGTTYTDYSDHYPVQGKTS